MASTIRQLNQTDFKTRSNPALPINVPVKLILLLGTLPKIGLSKFRRRQNIHYYSVKGQLVQNTKSISQPPPKSQLVQCVYREPLGSWFASPIPFVCLVGSRSSPLGLLLWLTLWTLPGPGIF